jgi:hypothetical protein
MYENIGNSRRRNGHMGSEISVYAWITFKPICISAMYVNNNRTFRVNKGYQASNAKMHYCSAF